MTEAEWLSSEDPGAMLQRITKPGDSAWPQPVRISDRKLRLFACAVVRQVWHLLSDPRSRQAVEVAERYADGKATRGEYNEAGHQASSARKESPFCPWNDATPNQQKDMATLAVANIWQPHAFNAVTEVSRLCGRFSTQANLLREIVGNPYRQVTLPCQCHCGPRKHWPVTGECPDCGSEGWCPWLTPTVLSLALAAYENRPGRAWSGMVEGEMGPEYHSGKIEDGSLDPVRLSILADALEEAGCTDEAILRHLRGWEWVSETGYGMATSPWRPLRSPHVRGCWVLDLLLGKE